MASDAKAASSTFQLSTKMIPVTSINLQIRFLIFDFLKSLPPFPNNNDDDDDDDDDDDEDDEDEDEDDDDDEDDDEFDEEEVEEDPLGNTLPKLD